MAPPDDSVGRDLPEPRSDDADWRIEQYQRMGFDFTQAAELGRARDRMGFHVWWKHVEDARAAGLSHLECVALFCTHLD